MKTDSDPQRTFTTTLPVSLLHDLDQAAKELHMPKNAIIAEAFTVWNKERKQARLAESYARGHGKDREKLRRLANEGFDE